MGPGYGNEVRARLQPVRPAIRRHATRSAGAMVIGSCECLVCRLQCGGGAAAGHVVAEHRGAQMHVGLIGGIGPAATEFYYRGLTDRHANSGTRLDLTIANAEVRDLSQNLANKDARKQAGIFAALVSRLKAAGAQVAAVTSMGGHFCVGELIPISPLPILNGIPEVDAAVTRGRFKTIGIGTRMVMETRLYGA